MTFGGTSWRPLADRIAGVCAAHLPVVTGVYVHGSAALGGFSPASDLDVLVVGDGASDWAGLGRSLLSEATILPLELTVVAPTAAAGPAPPWPFQLHVASPACIVLDGGEGDPDLCAHYAVARQAGITITGAAAEDVAGPVPRTLLLDYLRAELAWGLAHADQRYAVLNACRAEAYAAEGLLLSKIGGGRWWALRHGPEPLVQEALSAQAAGRDLGSCTRSARELVHGVSRMLARP